jgi:hypothetical protein
MSRFERRVVIALAASVMAVSWVGAVAAAEIYKWVDENGTTHYSDTRPSGVKSTILTDSKVSVIPGSRIGAEAARAAERERIAARREAVMPTADEAQARAQRREQLMQDCLRNNGVECDREVDTQLRSEGIQEGRGVVRTVPPPVSVSPSPTSVPATSSAPSSQSSRIIR